MQYQVLDVTTGTAPTPAKLYTYFLDNSPEIDPARTRPVIVLCPGGGYRFTSDREAEGVAMQFLAAGIHVAILRYTVAPQGEYPQALREVAWSVAHIREHAAQYHVDPDKILVMGFSAGGHLAASYGMFWKNHTFLAEELGVSSEQLRPNGMILGYPVITSGEKAHRDSFVALLGDRYDALVKEMSLEHQVSADTPPVFLWHTETDELVPVENSMYLFEALHTHHIPVEMHIYPTGEHGLSLANEETHRSDGSGIIPACQSWIKLAVDWVKRR